MNTQFIGTPFCCTLELCFEDNNIEVKGKINVSFGIKELPNLKGEL